MPMTWCVAHTQPSKELIAQHHLLEQGYAVYLPRFKKLTRHARKVEEKLVPLFPRYLFVGMDLDIAMWRSINGTRGVSYLLTTPNHKPATIANQIIEELRASEGDEGIVPVSSLHQFVVGDKVRILEGAFKDQIATFGAADGAYRVQLLLNFMGRQMQLALPSFAVESA